MSTSIVWTVVRFPWSSKPKEKDTVAADKTVKVQPVIDQNPDDRLWDEVGYLEAMMAQGEYYSRPVPSNYDPRLAAIPMDRKLDVPTNRYCRNFRNLRRTPLVFDIFRRSGSTEVLAYVWWADWDDIDVKSTGDGFTIRIDLGPKREVEIRPNSTWMLGGQWQVLYKQKGLANLPEPALQIEDSILHLLFEGVVIHNRDHTWGGGSVKDLQGEGLIEGPS